MAEEAARETLQHWLLCLLIILQGVGGQRCGQQVTAALYGHAAEVWSSLRQKEQCAIA